MILTSIIISLFVLAVVTKAAKDIADMKDEARLIQMKRQLDKKNKQQKTVPTIKQPDYRIITRMDDNGNRCDFMVRRKD